MPSLCHLSLPMFATRNLQSASAIIEKMRSAPSLVSPVNHSTPSREAAPASRSSCPSAAAAAAALTSTAGARGSPSMTPARDRMRAGARSGIGSSGRGGACRGVGRASGRGTRMACCTARRSRRCAAQLVARRSRTSTAARSYRCRRKQTSGKGEQWRFTSSTRLVYSTWR